ncbi:MAG TPA: sugar-binding protein, partial [Bacteroidia bacterium]|nr:sugar-binding protein [Bacteroidia bacterium]
MNSIHSPINSSTAKLDSQLVTGLTSNTVYHYLATDGTDNGSDVMFVTAPNPPGVGAPNTPTANGFTATWTAPATMGAAPYTYTIQASSDPTFATGVIAQTGISSGATSFTFTTLSSATQYYYRVEAVNATASSVWSANSTPISTLIAPTPACTTGNGSPGTTGTISSATTAPVIDGNIDPVWSTVPSNNITQKINVADEGSGLQAAPNNTATWKTIWDVNNLYILVQVTDAVLVSQGPLAGATDIATLNAGANPWDVDGIEFYLDGNDNKGGAYDNTNDFQLRFNLGSTTVTGSSGNAPFALLAPRINFKMVVTAGGYLLEAAIPWSGPGGINSGAYPTVAAGNKIGIDFSINDNDGTSWRTAQQGWYDGLSGSVNQYNNTTLFGTATLATCPVPPTVVLPTVTNITATGATLGATVTSSGDSPLTARGTEYTASPITTGSNNAVA